MRSGISHTHMAARSEHWPNLHLAKPGSSMPQHCIAARHIAQMSMGATAQRAPVLCTSSRSYFSGRLRRRSISKVASCPGE